MTKSQMRVAGFSVASMVTIMLLSFGVSTSSAFDFNMGYEDSDITNQNNDATGITERVSVDSDGNVANHASFYPSLSADGRFVAFSSYANNLVEEKTTTNRRDIFVHDRCTGLTEYVSYPREGYQETGHDEMPSISSDGRYVVFTSQANLVIEDTRSQADIFIHDRATRNTELISIASDGTQAQGGSLYPSISGDGRIVAFVSEADNLFGSDYYVFDQVFTHDRYTGVTDIVSASPTGDPGNRGLGYGNPDLSYDGRYVSFHSGAINLVPSDTNDSLDVFVHDRETGLTERVSVSSDGTQGNGISVVSSISSDGRFVAYSSIADNLVSSDDNSKWDIFVHDRNTGKVERISVASDGSQGNGNSFRPSISGDGRYVAFYSYADNLVVGDTNNLCDTNNDDVFEENCPDVFIHDRENGVTKRVSVASDGSEANAGGNIHSQVLDKGPDISADGSVVGFSSNANNLTELDINSEWDVFVHIAQPVFSSISGTVTSSSGQPIPGIIISDGDDHTATTNESGQYQFTGVLPCTYSVKPISGGLAFTPSSQEVTVPPDAVSIDFLASGNTFIPILIK